MSPLLPNELLLSILTRYPCREQQVRQFATLLRTCPRNLVLHGLEATGKSIITKTVLEQLGLRNALVKSSECVTGRMLLERTVRAVADALRWKGEVGRCESLASLAVELQILLERRWGDNGMDGDVDMDGAVNGLGGDGGGGNFILVFDGIDKQRDAPPTLLPALGRLSEIVSPWMSYRESL